MIRRVAARIKDWFAETAKLIRPHVVDPWAFAIVAAAFSVAVFLVAWHATTLRLEAAPANLAWIVIVAFGTTWHGEWGSGWRTGAGLLAGSLAAMAGFYGSLARFPVTPFAVALAMGITALGIAVICHLFPRVLSFAGAAVGFGVGVAAAREFGFRPTTAADDLYAVMLTTTLAVALGVFGSMALRAFVVRVGVRRPGEYRVLHMPHWAQRAVSEVDDFAHPMRKRRAAVKVRAEAEVRDVTRHKTEPKRAAR